MKRDERPEDRPPTASPRITQVEDVPERHFEIVNPSRERQDETAGLLDAVAAFVGCYLVFSKPQACAVALWALHTHVFDAADTTPYLSITSAEKASGKTRLLEVLELVVAKPWRTGRVTPPALARKVHAERPTLLLDETDATFAGDPEFGQVLRGLLNSGYRRGGKSSVCVGQGANIGYVDLDTFAPKALAGLGELPDTVASRSIRITLKRKAPSETVERFRRREAIESGEPLRQWAADWGERFVDVLANANPELPEDLADRAADSWEPLFAIADLAGGDWSGRARAAALELSGEAVDADASIRVRLLADCQLALNGYDRLSTKDLIGSLAEDEEAPWGGWHKGSPISPRSLAGLLEPFGIHSRQIRLDDVTLKGAGLEHRSPYALRHTFASFAIAAGVPLFELSRFMGTSVEQIGRTYGHLLPDSLDRARTALDGFLATEQKPQEAFRD